MREQDRGQVEVVDRVHATLTARRLVLRTRLGASARARCSGPCRWRRSSSGTDASAARAVREQRRACRPRCGARTHRGWAAASGGRRGCARPTARPGCARTSRSRWVSAMAPTAAVISTMLTTSKVKTYWVKIASRDGLYVPAGALVGRPRHRAASLKVARPMPAISRQAKPSSQQDAGDALAAQGLDERVGGVDADQHEHEQEQHHHRAGVDHDLDHAEEDCPLHQEQHGQDDHGQRHPERAVHRLAAQQDHHGATTANGPRTQKATASPVDVGAARAVTS